MAKQEQAVRYDKDGAVLTMKTGDYLADMSGQPPTSGRLERCG